MADLASTQLVDLLPSSISGDADVIAAASAIDGELQRVTSLIPTVVLLARVDVLPEAVLDLLAWQFHVDFYEPVGFSIEKKRAVIKSSIAWHRKKGTPWAVEQVVASSLNNAVIEEWPEYGGDPYHFRIATTDIIESAEDYSLLRRAIDTAKNARSWLDKITINRELTFNDDMGLHIGLINEAGGMQTAGIQYPDRADATINISIAHYAGGIRSVGVALPDVANLPLVAGFAYQKSGKITIKNNPEDISARWYEEMAAGLAGPGE